MELDSDPRLLPTACAGGLLLGAVGVAAARWCTRRLRRPPPLRVVVGRTARQCDGREWVGIVNPGTILFPTFLDAVLARPDYRRRARGRAAAWLKQRVPQCMDGMRAKAEAGPSPPEAGGRVTHALLRWAKDVDSSIFFEAFRSTDDDERDFYRFMRDLHALHGRRPELWGSGDAQVRSLVSSYLRRYTEDAVFLAEPFVQAYLEECAHPEAAVWFAVLLSHAGMRTGIEFLVALLARLHDEGDLTCDRLRTYEADYDTFLCDVRARGVDVLPRLHPTERLYAPCALDDPSKAFIWGSGSFMCPGYSLSAHNLYPTMVKAAVRLAIDRWEDVQADLREVAGRARMHRSYATDPGIAFFGAAFQTNLQLASSSTTTSASDGDGE
jgi:hypothetical protein